MKKIFFVVIVACIFLSACSQAPSPEKEIYNNAEFVATEPTVSEVTVIEQQVKIEQPVIEVQIEEEKPVVSEKPKQETSISPTEKPAETAPPKAQEQPPVETPAPEPVITPKPITPTPEPTPVPTPEPPPQPAFDVAYWVQFAKDYGTSIGMKLDSTATGSWDTPIGANAKCIYLERDIKDGLNWYKNDYGYEYFWVWSEQIGENRYNIYIGYA